MQLTYDGIDYNYNPTTHVLSDCYGADVARVELASESNYDEYDYYIDINTGEVMHSEYAQPQTDLMTGRKLAAFFSTF